MTKRLMQTPRGSRCVALCQRLGTEGEEALEAGEIEIFRVEPNEVTGRSTLDHLGVAARERFP